MGLMSRRKTTHLALTLGLASAVVIAAAAPGAWSAVDGAPTKVLAGSATGLNEPFDIAVDSKGRLYAVSRSTRSVTAYAAEWAPGDTAPFKTLEGPPYETGLSQPLGIAFDSADRMYITNQDGGISVYAADWAGGATAPVKRLDTSALGSPLYVAFDSSGRMYVTFEAVGGAGSLVAAFAADWISSSPDLVVTADPIKVLQGTSTGLGVQTTGLAFDDQGVMYVVTSGTTFEDGTPKVNAYAADWASGDTSPVKVLQGSNTGLSNSLDVAIDSLGRMHVSNLGGSVTTYAARWANGDTPPVETRRGGLTRVTTPLGLGCDTAGNLYVANFDQAVDPMASSILMFAPPKDVQIKGARPNATKIVVTGTTVGVRIGSTVTPYLKKVSRGQKFKALPPVKVTGKSVAKGAFSVQVTGLEPKKAYQMYVVVDGVRTKTVTLAARP